MIIKHRIGMELDRVDVDKEIYVMQDDKYSREMEIHLKANGKEYYPPEECMVLVRYEKPDGRGGAYDVLPDGRKAAEIHGNVVTVGLAPQVCTVVGRVMLTVTLRHQEKELSCFSIYIHVQKSANSKLGSEQYYHIRGFVPQPDSAVVGEYIKVADVDEQGRIVSVATGLEVAKHGKSAYQYAQEAGYAGTEEEFSAKLAAKNGGIHVGVEAPVDDACNVWIDTDEMYEDTTVNQAGVLDVTDARVGQTIRIAAVEENGRPAVWEAVDYQPRTHWVEGKKTLLFEGNTDSGGNIEEPRIDEIYMEAGKNYELEWDGVVYRDTARYLYEVLGIQPNSNYTLPSGSNLHVSDYDIVWGDLSYYLGGDPTMPVSIESTDTYMRLYNMGGGSGVRHIAIYESEVVRKLDEKFLPESVKYVVIRSSTEGSAKTFTISADDHGLIIPGLVESVVAALPVYDGEVMDV